MSIVLFAIIGAKINVGTGYWICFAIYCLLVAIKIMFSVIKDNIN